ncbi:hypothetical protein ACVIRO_002370 [Rhizobium ruizarguesonis]
MTFLTGLLFCAGAAGVFAAFVYVVRRMEREPLLDEMDFDQATPDGLVQPLLEDKR